MGAHRCAASPCPGRDRARHHRRHLDRRGRRWVLCGRPARRTRRFRPRPDQAQDLRLPRFQPVRLWPYHRPARDAAAGKPSQGRQDRRDGAEVRRRRDRIRHRTGDLDLARVAGRGDARLLCAARHFQASRNQQPLAVRWRALQPGTGVGLPCTRCSLRHRGQPQRRRLWTRQPLFRGRRLGSA